MKSISALPMATTVGVPFLIMTQFCAVVTIAQQQPYQHQHHQQQQQQQQRQQPQDFNATDFFQGETSIGCTDGICAFSGDCTALNNVPGSLAVLSNDTSLTDENNDEDIDVDDDDEVTQYSNINGDFRLQPASCEAECTGCLIIVIPDESDISDISDSPTTTPSATATATATECIVAAGFIYCPEIDECIRPWQDNCPFDGGDSFEGPIDIVCAADDSGDGGGGRCHSLSDDCLIAVGSAIVGGPYLTGLIGQYTLPEGCTATCEGCGVGNGSPDRTSTPPTGEDEDKMNSGSIDSRWVWSTSLMMMMMMMAMMRAPCS